MPSWALSVCVFPFQYYQHFKFVSLPPVPCSNRAIAEKCLSQVAEELGTPLFFPPSSFLYLVSFFPPQNCQHSAWGGQRNVILPWGERVYRIGLDLEWEKRASGSIQSVGLQRSRWVTGTWVLDLWWRVSHVTLSCVWSYPTLPDPEQTVEAGAVGGSPSHHVTTSTSGAEFFLLTRFSLSPCGCFLNCRSTGQKERNSFSAWRWRFFGTIFLCLWVSTANRELPSFWLKLHIFFFPLSCFQSWQPHKSSIQGARAKDVGRHERSISCPPGPLFPLCCLYRVLLGTLRSRNFASNWSLDAVGHGRHPLPVWQNEFVSTVCRKKI